MSESPDARERPRREAGAPPWWRAAVAFVVTAAYLFWSSVPGGLLAGFGPGLFLLAPLGLVVAVWLLADYALRVRAVWVTQDHVSPSRNDPERGKWIRWTAIPTCLAIAISAHLTLWPLRLRFELSRAAFDEVVREVESGTDPDRLTGRIGLLPVRTIMRYGINGIYFQTGLAGFDRVGLDHCSTDGGCQYGQVQLDERWSLDRY